MQLPRHRRKRRPRDMGRFKRETKPRNPVPQEWSEALMNEKLIAEEMKAVDQEIQERMKMSERDLKKHHRKKYAYNPGRHQDRRPPPFTQVSKDQLEEITRNGKQERKTPEPHRLFRGKLAKREPRRQ